MPALRKEGGGGGGGGVASFPSKDSLVVEGKHVIGQDKTRQNSFYKTCSKTFYSKHITPQR